MQRTRDLPIDRYRGALVVLMVIGDYLGGVNWVPAFLKHAPDVGFTIADTVAPAFVFVIALNFRSSFEHHLRAGQVAAYRHFSLRYLSLIGVGAIITGGSALADRATVWGVLESLGVAGLLTMLVIRLPGWARATIGALLLCVYQLALDSWMLESVLASGHGGFFGALSWSAQMMLATALADLFRKGMKAFVAGTVAVAVLATIMAFIVPISKNRVSLSYILLTLAISAVVLLLIKLGTGNRHLKAGVLSWWGQHALGMYVLHLLLLSLFGLPPIPWWYVDAPLWLVALQLSAVLVVMSLVARRLSVGRSRS